jgi:proteic killer suppression protein
MDVVELSQVKKEIKKLPLHVKRKLLEWSKAVELEGINEVRKQKGYHDEPLKGKRKGQRSVRLSRSYRAIYTQKANGEINILLVEEVNKHEY